jgi:hypothetical protein
VPAPADDCRDGLEQEAQILAEAPVVDVPEVQVHPVLEGDLVPAAHLPDAGEARHHGETTKLPGLVLGDFLGHRRPGADERHVATKHVDELRKLVDAESPQNFPEWRDARVIAHLEDGPALLVLVLERLLQRLGARHHRAELQDVEEATVLAHAQLAVEGRPGRGELHQHCHHR